MLKQLLQVLRSNPMGSKVSYYHAVPGGWYHLGRLGHYRIFKWTNGYANAQRTLNYIRIIAEFILSASIQRYQTGLQLEKMIVCNLYRTLIILWNLVTWTLTIFVMNAGGDWGCQSTTLFPFKISGCRLQLSTLIFTASPQRLFQPMHNAFHNMRVSCQHFTDCGLFLNGVGLGSQYEWTYTSGVWPPIGNCSTSGPITRIMATPRR